MKENIEKEKPVLNIIVADGSHPQQYIDYLNKIFNVNVLKNKDNPSKNDVDLILFTGGEDVNPINYDQKIGKFTQCNDKRDNLEIDVFYKYKDVCKFGICRGSQLLTVLNGGQLIQHVSGHGRSHSISIKDYGDYMITSTHHQMMYPFNLKEKDYNLIAWATKFQSDTYLNGNDEETELSIDFLEPEIVEYYNSKSLCIQGHPEFAEKDIQNVTLDLLKTFLNKYKKDVQVKWVPQEDGGLKYYNNLGEQIRKPTIKKSIYREEPLRSQNVFDQEMLREQLREISKPTFTHTDSISTSKSIWQEMREAPLPPNMSYGEQIVFGTSGIAGTLGNGKLVGGIDPFYSPNQFYTQDLTISQELKDLEEKRNELLDVLIQEEINNQDTQEF